MGIALQLGIFVCLSRQLADRIGVSAVKLHPPDIANVGLLQDVARSSISKVLFGTDVGSRDLR